MWAALRRLGLLPAAWTFYLGASDQLGADPVKTFEQASSASGPIRFLITTLAVQPRPRSAGMELPALPSRAWASLLLLCLMHFTVYMVLDQALDISAVVSDVLKRPFISVRHGAAYAAGAAAVTSNNYSIRNLGPKWIWLHRLVYIIAACGRRCTSRCQRSCSISSNISMSA